MAEHVAFTWGHMRSELLRRPTDVIAVEGRTTDYFYGAA